MLYLSERPDWPKETHSSFISAEMDREGQKVNTTCTYKFLFCLMDNRPWVPTPRVPSTGPFLSTMNKVALSHCG
jgi:hypothetical protein